VFTVKICEYKMTITKPTARAKTVCKAGDQVAISLAMPPELLDQIDQAAAASNISRAAFIKHALSRAVNAETT
jgi:hypothetical protein